LGVVGSLAQLGWATLNFSALPVWVNFDLRLGKYLGLILGAFMLTEAVLRPTCGALSDKIGRKPLMLCGPFLGIFTAVATVFTANVPVMFLLRAIDGIGLAAFWPAAFAAAGDAVDEKSRSTAMSVVNGCSLAGIALGFPLGGLANDLSHSHTGAFYLCSGIFLVALIAGLIILPREAHKHHEHAEEDHHIPHADEVRGMFHMIPDMLVLSVVVFTAIGLLMPVVKVYAMEQLGMTETRFGTLICPVAGALVALSLPFGKIADKWGKLASFCYGLALCTLSMWVISIFRCLWALAAAGAVLGVGFALAFPAWMAVVSQAAPPARRGQVLGAVGLAQGIGAIIGSALGPIIYNTEWLSLPRLGVMNRNLPFYLCAILLSISTVMAFSWIARLRACKGNGRPICWAERRAIMAMSLIGIMAICGWIVFRYAKPLPPDRVAWLWVQSAINNNVRKAERYTLPSFEKPNADGRTASEMAANIYNHWSTERKAYYTPPSCPNVSGDGNHAEVRVVFHFKDKSNATEKILLVKQPNGEWKIAEKHAEVK
jgi:DHA1 family multidrug resistance protein-like MFS transporter